MARLSPVDREFARAWPLIDSIDGFLESPHQERWLFGAALSLPEGSTIVEVGSYKGRSTSALAFACTGTGKRVFAIDTFDGNEADFHERGFLGTFLGNLEERGLSGCVTAMPGRSVEIAAEWRRPINLLFIDGSHVFQDVVADFQGFFPHVVPGGIVALHDVVHTWPGPLRAWDTVVRPRVVSVGACGSLAYGRKPRRAP